MNILCYGDSNTFSYNPFDGSRFEQNSRWSGILKELLPSNSIIEAGLNNRTGLMDSPDGLQYCAYKHLPTILNGVDILILAIGTNDSQFRYDFNIETIEKRLEKLLKESKEKVRKIIVLSPILLDEKILKGNFKVLFDRNSIKKSALINKSFENICKKLGCKYLDLNDFITPSSKDGLHYDKEAHRAIAKLISQIISP